SRGIAKGLSDPDVEVRKATLAALKTLGREARDAIPALRSASVWDDVPEVWKAVGEVLAKVEGPTRGKAKAGAPPLDAAGLLATLRSGEKTESARTAIVADPAAPPLLLPLLTSAEAPVRIRAIEVFGDLSATFVTSAAGTLSAGAADADAGV